MKNYYFFIICIFSRCDNLYSIPERAYYPLVVVGRNLINPEVGINEFKIHLEEHLSPTIADQSIETTHQTIDKTERLIVKVEQSKERLQKKYTNAISIVEKLISTDCDVHKLTYSVLKYKDELHAHLLFLSKLYYFSDYLTEQVNAQLLLHLNRSNQTES